MLLSTFRNLIPQPRESHQPRHYVGRHRQPIPVEIVVEEPEPSDELEAESHAA